jgi:WD40 repeat protein
MVQSVKWLGREVLLTASSYDGVVALWDLDRPVIRAPGHDEHVVDVSLLDDADVVASVDVVGTVVARRASSGRPVAAPLATEVLHTRTVALWALDRDVFATTTAGSQRVPDNRLRQWNLVTGVQQSPAEVASSHLQCLARARVEGKDVLVTFDPQRKIRLWDPADGMVIAEIMTGLTSHASGFATGIDGGRPVVALSDGRRPLERYALDDLKAAPVIIPEAGDGSVLAVAGPFVVTGHRHRQYGPLRTVRVWDVSGQRFGTDVRGDADITAAAVRTWPSAYIGRADGTVSLTDLETGEDLCRPLLLPSRPITLTVASDGDLIVGFGSDLARFRPPVR